MSLLVVKRRRRCKQDDTYVWAVSSMSSDRRQKSPTSVWTQTVRRHNKLMTGSRTKMMSWGSRHKS